MRIKLEESESGYCASDDVDGRFYPDSDGRILYTGPEDMDSWYVNANLEKFRRALKAYENYGKEVLQRESEQEQLEVVAQFRDALLAIEDYREESHSYWACIVQQAEEGQL